MKDKEKNTDKSLAQLREEISKIEANIDEKKREQKRKAEQREDMEVLYTWEAPERPFKTKSRIWYINVFGIATAVIILSVLTQTWLLIIATISVVVMLYALNTVPPQTFSYEISNKGLRIGKKMYLWNQIPEFWITKRSEDLFLNLNLRNDNKRIVVLIGDGDPEIIAKEMVRYVDYLSPEEVPTDIVQQLVEGAHQEIGEFYDKKEDNAQTQTAVIERSDQKPRKKPKTRLKAKAK
jgi:hypothetical protein